MLDGFAFCGEDAEYEHTYLDRIKIGNNQENYLDCKKPVHIDKLFENEEAFLDDPMEETKVKPLKKASKPSFSSCASKKTDKNSNDNALIRAQSVRTTS